MKVIVTGALGHIGSRLIRELPYEFNDLEIIMIDDLSTLRYSSLFNLPSNAKYKFIEGDVRKLDLDNIFNRVDAVVHLAAITDATSSVNNADYVKEVNYNSTMKVANSCINSSVPMLTISSTSVYGTQNSVVDENCSEEELCPQSPYAESKLEEERAIQDLIKSEGLNSVIYRFGTISGTSTGMRFHTAVNKFCWQAVMGLPLTVWTTAMDQKRPYLDLHDAVNAISLFLKRKIEMNTLYNVVTDNLSVRDITEQIKNIIPDLKISYVDEEIMNQLSYEVLSEKIKNQGFVIEGNIKKSISETINLLKNSNNLSLNNDYS